MPPVPLLSKVAGPTTVTSEGDSAFNPANWLELAEQPTSVTARLLLRVNPLLVELVTTRPYRNTPSDSLTVTLPTIFAVDPYHAPMLMLKALLTTTFSVHVPVTKMYAPGPVTLAKAEVMVGKSLGLAPEQSTSRYCCPW